MSNRRRPDIEDRNRGESSGPPDHGPRFSGEYARDPRGSLAGENYARDLGWSGGGRADQYTREEEPQRPSYRGIGPRNWTSDGRIRGEVCDRLADHPRIDASRIEVTVSGQEVTLQGEVRDRAEKRLAEDLAEACRGVRDVHNRLVIRPHEIHLGKASE